MKFQASDFILPAVLYSLEIYETDLTEKDITSIRNAMLHYRKRFPEVSFFFGVSTTDSASASRKTISTGKRGRPRTIIDGKKTDAHVHIGAIGKSKYQESARPFLNSVKNSVDKRMGRKISRVVGKGNNVHAIGFMGYSYKQCTPFEQSGDFDFRYYGKDTTGFYYGN